MLAWFVPVAGAIGWLLLAACAPRSEYRHAAYVPAARPLAWDGQTLPEGSLRLEGAASGTEAGYNWTPKLGDSALYVPKLTLEGLAALALGNGFELGIRAAYADWTWAQSTAAGTLPIPENPNLWGVGPELHGTVRFGENERFALGFGGNLLRYSIATSRWQLDMQCAPSPTCIPQQTTEGPARYQYVGSKHEAFLVSSVALYPSVSFGEKAQYGHLFFGPSLHEGFQNEGFTNSVSQSSGSTLERSGFVWFVGAGYGIDLYGARLSAMFAIPLSGDNSAVDYEYAAFATIGTAVELWDGAQTP